MGREKRGYILYFQGTIFLGRSYDTDMNMQIKCSFQKRDAYRPAEILLDLKSSDFVPYLGASGGSLILL